MEWKTIVSSSHHSGEASVQQCGQKVRGVIESTDNASIYIAFNAISVGEVSPEHFRVSGKWGSAEIIEEFASQYNSDAG